MSEHGAKIYYPDFGQNNGNGVTDLPPADPGLPDNPRLWPAHFSLVEYAQTTPVVIEFIPKTAKQTQRP
jgi:hypothetical protein